MTASTSRKIVSLTREATLALRRATTAEGQERTRLLRRVADLLVDLRALHTDQDGLPDWRGKTYAYRDLVNDIYSGAGLPKDSGDTTKTALRYHVGNALRDRLSAEELAEVGLSALDPRDRQQHRRAALDAAEMQDAPLLIGNVHLYARRLDDASMKGVTHHDLARVEDSIKRLQDFHARAKK